ncbi:hypothetical protein [uncultured Psychrobacter sp.]|uniref:hypothetical protein n=1 Tax=uncultured Psychrobacter sp. TaxID=259303 RepID=UPI003458955E
MSVVNKERFKWQQVAGIGVICGLAVVGCDRSDKEAETESATETAQITTEEPTVSENETPPAVSCDNPMVQERLKTALKSTLNQQAQTLAANYASAAEVSIDNSVISSKVNGILIDIQNTAVLQEANANGMTTCQASVSMTLPSEDLYQASQIGAANNQPSLQTRLAQQNIRMNNNMLVDDAFAYVAGTRGGQMQVRMAGQPALVTIVADVVASSTVKSAVDTRQAARRAQEAERQAEQAARRREAARIEREERARQPIVVTPIEPTRPAEPAAPPTPPTVNENNSQAALPSVDAQAPTTPEMPKAAPNDDSIDMVIIEDESAVY